MRSLSAFAVSFLLTQGAAFAVDASRSSNAALGNSGSSAALSANVGHSIVDDLIAANDQREQRGFAERSNTAAYREKSTDTSVTELPVFVPQADESDSWILGAFGAVFALGIGIAVAGVYWSGPRAFARW